MPSESMTPRERWLAVLNRQKPDRIPMDYWATDETTRNLLQYMHCEYDDMLKKLNLDIPITVSGKYIGPPTGNYSIFGIQYKEMHYATGSYMEAIYSPLAQYSSVDEIENHYRWPSPDDWDYSHLPEFIKGKEHLPIRGGGSEPFLLYKLLRGDMQAYLDLIQNPEIVYYCLDKLFELAYQKTLRIFESIPGSVVITYIAEDLGGQDRLMYSPEHIRKYLFPGMKRMIELTKQHGSFVFHHDDGSIREILPDLIELGIEVLNPIQWRCQGMERRELKNDFGHCLIFHGGVDNQQTLPFGKVDDVHQEVLDNYTILGNDGGYILAPCHNIQSITPPQNIIEMYKTGYEYGWN